MAQERYDVILNIDPSRIVTGTDKERWEAELHAIAEVRARVEAWILERDPNAAFYPERGTHISPIFTVVSDISVMRALRDPVQRPEDVSNAGRPPKANTIRFG